MSLRRGVGLAIALIVASSPAFGLCPGDCDGNEEVSVNELILSVGVALERAPLSACPAIDSDGNGSVVLVDLLRAVNASLGGCPLCGNGRIDPGEECDVGDPEVRCFTDCTVCCEGSFDCVTSRCCSDEREDGLLLYDPECRECGELGQGCGSFQVLEGYELGCCDNLICGELTIVDDFRAVSGTCCPPAGSPCVTDDDCCGGSDFVFSTPGDACVEETCCVRTGGLCQPGAANPCCNPGEQCLPIAANVAYHTCRVAPAPPEPCVEEVCGAGDFEAACCGENRACERVVRDGVRACCGRPGAPCSRNFKADCCSGVCRIDDDGAAVCE